MTDKKTLLLAQLLITLMMAATMSGIMSLIAMGPSLMWLSAWPKQFLIAFPIAFVLSLIASRLAFGIAHRLRPVITPDREGLLPPCRGGVLGLPPLPGCCIASAMVEEPPRPERELMSVPGLI